MNYIRLFFTGLFLPLVLAVKIIGVLKAEWELSIWRILRVKRAYQGSKTHGDATQADHYDYFHAGMTRNEGGFIVGKIADANGFDKPIFTDREHSVIMYGQAGSGKSQLIRANLWHAGQLGNLPDLIVFDPTGEHDQAMSRYLASRGYCLARFDMTDDQRSIRYNPLVELDVASNTFHEDVRNICHLIIPDDASEKQGHFRRLPRRLLAGSIVYHMTQEPERATLNQCLSAIKVDLPELKSSQPSSLSSRTMKP